MGVLSANQFLIETITHVLFKIVENRSGKNDYPDLLC